MPGAFSRALAAKPDVRGRYNHEQILARSKSGTLRLSEDARGLRYEIDIGNTSTGRDVAESIRRGDVDGSSFCFRVMGSDGETWRKSTGASAMPVRELRCLELLDVGPVDSPAYPGTEGQIGLRSLPEASRKAAAEVAGLSGGTPNLRHARLRFAELGLRYYVESVEDEAALADACRQACGAIDSLNSLCWKMPDSDDCRAACTDAMVLCQALGQVLSNPESDVLPGLADLTAAALTSCAKAAKGIDHPIAKLAAAVCAQTADQCEGMGNS